ncbi:MAG: hypothetical protein ACM34K_17765 [Bacillota bacterium]
MNKVQMEDVERMAKIIKDHPNEQARQQGAVNNLKLYRGIAEGEKFKDICTKIIHILNEWNDDRGSEDFVAAIPGGIFKTPPSNYNISTLKLQLPLFQAIH